MPKRTTTTTPVTPDPIADAFAAQTATINSMLPEALLPEALLNKAPAEVMQKWARDVGREQLNLYLACSGAALRSMRALYQAQLTAADHSDNLHDAAATRLRGELGLDEIADIQLRLGSEATESMVRYWTDLENALMRCTLEATSELGTGLLRLTQAIGSLGNQLWSAKLPESTETMQAEVEHVLAPIASSPLVWPTQEAARAAFTATATAWNDLLNWQGQFAQASQRMLGVNGSTDRSL